LNAKGHERTRGFKNRIELVAVHEMNDETTAGL
jgi:hypothetical protein